MSRYDEVRAAWDRASRDGHVGMSDAFRIVEAAANTDEGRRALADLLGPHEHLAIVEPDALSYLRISRDLPLPPGAEDHRADVYFRTRFYTGMRVSKTHQLRNPLEFLYFDFAIVMLTGMLDDVAGVRGLLRGSGYEPVIVGMPGGRDRAIGIVMVNEFRDSTFGPYNEVIFIVTAVTEDAPARLRRVDYVNAFSLQIPLDLGATVYALKLWLNEVGPIDGGNDFLGTNKELGSFRFADTPDGRREFRSWDRELAPLVSGTVPRTMAPGAAAAAHAAYQAAAARADSVVPAGTVTTIAVASRPDEDVGKPASRWAFAADWRRVILQPVGPADVGLTFGEAEWGRRFERFGFTPALSFYSPSGVGQILQHIGDSPYGTSASAVHEAVLQA